MSGVLGSADPFLSRVKPCFPVCGASQSVDVCVLADPCLVTVFSAGKVSAFSM